MTTTNAKEVDPTSESMLTLSHFGINVRDLERSANFYCNALGYKRGAAFHCGPEVGGLVGLKDPEFDVQIVARGNQLIELICFASPPPFGPTEARQFNQLGLTHLNIRVKDLEAVAKLIAEHGGTVLNETRYEQEVDAETYGVEAGHRTKLVFCTDPDGIRIELMQVPDAVRFARE